MTLSRRVTSIAAGAVGFILFIATWSWLASQMVAARLPSPEAVMVVLVESLTSSRTIAAQGGGTNGFLPHIWATYWHTMVAVALGALIGCLLGWAFASTTVFRWIVQPPIEILRLVPSLVAVPFFVLWFGIGDAPQFALIIGYTALVMQIAAFNAIRDFSPHIRNYALTLGAGRWELARTVLLPGALPGLLGSLRVTLQLAWGLAVVAELMGAQVGIGKVMQSSARLFRTDYVVVGVIWISVIAVLTDLAFRWAINRTTAWNRPVPHA